MEPLSIFDIFKIGVGPSSSHTLGPWKAALHFKSICEKREINKIQVHLYGSLSKTGRGHATDKAILLGLLGTQPETIDTGIIPTLLENVRSQGGLNISGRHLYFEIKSDIIFESFEHERHPNTLKFLAYKDDLKVAEELYASVGGGFIERNSEVDSDHELINLPYPIDNGKELIEYTEKNQCKISDIVKQNELAFRSKEDIKRKTEELIETMLECVYQGCTIEGILPGGLNVARRAKNLCTRLTGQDVFSSRSEWLKIVDEKPKSFNAVNNWVSCFALAVNEQNASMNRVVTSPTNGAAGVIPAVMLYYLLFCENSSVSHLSNFLYTAGEVGCLFKKGATISAAVGGCQAEIGVSSSMAAAGLTELLGGTPEQCLMAAEIAMEHHLGLTCDPVGGLVQIPCIERNAMGAIKAITASNLALHSDSEKAIVKLDTVIKTMWDTAREMNHKYKETSEGGLAIHLAVINPNC